MEKKDKIFVFGHKNPDTDSICSSVVMANLRSKLGENIEAVRLGNLNKETEYAFKHFNIEPPRLLDKLDEGSNVILVDHNEFSQSADGIEKANIKMLVDHHRVADFKTSEPVYMFSEPVGCTGTILYKLYNMNGVEIDQKMASLMLSSIVSDTLLFKSPTCTDDDRRAAEALQKIANIDVNSYGLEMLKAGTDLDDLTEEQLITLDAKEFNSGDVKFKIAQINTVSIPDVLKRQDKIEEAINKKVKEENLDLFVFAITDILNSNSELIALGDRTDIVEKTYKLENNKAFAEGIVSRKKQLLPLITDNI